MKVRELLELHWFDVLNEEGEKEREITKPYCCDLLSIAMGKAPAGAAWVTVMGNVNTIAVAALAEVAVVILAEGVKLDEMAQSRASQHGIIVLATKDPIFETAYRIETALHG